MSDNRTNYCKMSENRKTYDNMLENLEKYWQFPEGALATDWKCGCGGRSPRHFYFNFCLRYYHQLLQSCVENFTCGVCAEQPNREPKCQCFMRNVSFQTQLIYIYIYIYIRHRALGTSCSVWAPCIGVLNLHSH